MSHEDRDGLEADQKLADFMAAEARKGEPSNIRTEFLLRVLGLDICGDTEVGNALRPACSPGQKKRVTTGIHTPSLSNERIRHVLYT